MPLKTIFHISILVNKKKCTIQYLKRMNKKLMDQKLNELTGFQPKLPLFLRIRQKEQKSEQ